jgi:hypothetical protein
MTPRDFLEAIVRPNVADFHTRFADMRHAHNAISSVDALAAHLYVWAKSNCQAAVASSCNDSAYRGTLAAQNGDFALLRDIAKAQKHVHLTQGKPQVGSADQVTSRTIGWGKGRWGEGRWGGVQQVVVDIDATKLSFVETIVDNALAFLETEMIRLGA